MHSSTVEVGNFILIFKDTKISQMAIGLLWIKSKYIKPVGKLQSQNNQMWFYYDPAVNAVLIHGVPAKDISTDVLSNEQKCPEGLQRQVSRLPHGHLQPIDNSLVALPPSLQLWPLHLVFCEPFFLSCSLQSYYCFYKQLFLLTAFTHEL